MSRFDWLSELIARFQDEHILVKKGSRTTLAPAHLLHIEMEDWARTSAEAARFGCRWCGLWLEDQEMFFLANSCYEKEGDYLVLRTKISHELPRLPSLTPSYPAANRAERHAQDLFGIQFIGHPDQRRWTRHQAWKAHEYPLRKTFSVQGTLDEVTEPDTDYPYIQGHGVGVYEIPVGPVHAGIIEPGHFRFQAVGEMVLNLEEHLGYVHKGIEKIAEGRNIEGLARLAARVSGDSTVAHTWAACMAMERAASISVPPRALMLRAIMSERERIANHLGDIGAICNDVAFTFAFYQFSRLRELWQRVNQHSFGHRFMMDCIIPGGVKTDLTEVQCKEQLQQIPLFKNELIELRGILERHVGLKDRLNTTGILTQEYASQLGCLGYVGRASGRNYDLRRDAPYPPYDQFLVEVPCFTAGDVEARMQIRLEEILVSLGLLEKFLTQLPSGAFSTVWQPPPARSEGLGFVEGWRGETFAYVRFDHEGNISRYYPRDPSLLNWPALELLIKDNIVPDFPVCNKSINGSYSGHDL